MNHNNLLDNQNYYTGDIAAGWIGSLGGNSPQEIAATKTYVEKIFCSTNIIKACVDRYVESLVSQAPFLNLKPLGKVNKALVDASQVELDTLAISLNQMANMLSDKNTNLVKDWVLKALVEGKSWIRLFMPKRYRSNPNPFMRICAEIVSDDSVEIEKDEEGSPISLIHTISNDTQTKTRWERQVLNPDTGILTIESYNSQQSLEDRKPESSSTLDLGNNFALIPLRFNSLLTDTVKRIQDNCALLLTVSNRLAISSGFSERYLLNALPVGEEVKQADGSYAFEATPNASLTLGASTINYINGVPKGANDEDVTTPSVYIKEPSSAESLLKHLEVLTELLYAEFSQLHVLSSNEGTISSQSRLQMRHDFSNKVSDLASTLAPALGAMYKATLMLFGIVSGNPNYKLFDVVCELKLNAVVLTEQEHAEIREDWATGLIPHETALVMLNHDNPKELIAQINQETLEKSFVQPYEPLERFDRNKVTAAESED